MSNLRDIIACTLGVDVNDNYESNSIIADIDNECNYDELEELLKDF